MKIYPQKAKTPRELLVEKKYVEVRNSNIAGAGLGVFAKKDIQAGEELGFYRGEWLKLDDYSKGDRNFSYTLQLAKDIYIDAEHKAYNWVSRVNSPKGTCMKTNIYWDSEGRTFAKRNIKAGEELLVGYGSLYWRGIKNSTLKNKNSKNNTRKTKKD